MRTSNAGQLTIERQNVIPLPPRTRTLLEKKVATMTTYKALLQAEEQAINDLIAAAHEMLLVPDGWRMQDTAVGFVAPEIVPVAVEAAPAPGVAVEVVAESETIEA